MSEATELGTGGSGAQTSPALLVGAGSGALVHAVAERGEEDARSLDDPFKLQVDASNVGAGIVLLQEGEDGIDRPVCYFSRKFNSYQLNYSLSQL